MKLLHLLAPFILTPLASSINILVPLYVYPDTNASGWSALLSTIAAFPSVHWEIIVNPESGPGPDPYPDSNYIDALTKLNGHPNVSTVGYVEVHDTQEPLTSVQTQINQYADWASYAGANITVNGIFFDDTSNAATQANYDYMATVSGYVKAAFPSPDARVVCNPGTLAPEQLFQSCDTIVESEVAFANFDEETVVAGTPAAHTEASAIMVNTTPEGADIAGLIGTMEGKGIGGVYFGVDCCYNVLDAGILAAMARAL